MIKWCLIITFSFFLFIPQLCIGQWRCVVLNEDRKPVAGAIIHILDYLDASKSLFYTTTDIKGIFTYSQPNFPFKIAIRSMSSLPYEKVILNHKEVLDTIFLEPNSILLEDVLIDMNNSFASIKDDTIKFNLDNLNLHPQDNLKDILDRIPGFKVDDNYKIVHAGEEINKILVNGKEVFEYQNKIALDNMEAGMLDGLNIINDYIDPFKIVNNPYAKEKVIDLRLKEDFTNFVRGNIELWGGYKDKYKVKPFLFYFSDKVSVFTLNNFNTVYDKDWSSEDFSGANRMQNIDSRYFSTSNKKNFYSKDPTLSLERSYLNATTVKRKTDLYSFHMLFNYNKLHTLKLSDSYSRYLGKDYATKHTRDSTDAHMWNYMLDLKYKIRKHSILKIISSNYSDRISNINEYNAKYDFNNEYLDVLDNIFQISKVSSYKLELESQLTHNVSWSNGYSFRKENSTDNWNAVDLDDNNRFPLILSYKSIPVRNNEQRLHTQLNHYVTSQMHMNYAFSYQKVNNKLSFRPHTHLREHLTAFIDGYLKMRMLHIDWQLAYNHINQNVNSHFQKDYFLSAMVNANIFLDQYKRNKIRSRYQNMHLFAPLTIGIDSNIISRDHINISNPIYLLKLFPTESGHLSYVYDLPFKGQFFQISLYGKRNKETLLPTLNLENGFIWTYKLVSGLRRLGSSIGYSQHILKRYYPLKIDVNYEFNKDIFQQYNNDSAVPAKQFNHIVSIGLLGLSNEKFNSLTKMNIEWTNVAYDNSLLVRQQNMSFLIGPRYQYHNLTFKAFFKYNWVTNSIYSKTFYDVDFEGGYPLNKRMYLILNIENFLQNMGIRKSNTLSILDNQNGFEHLEAYRNTIGYSTIGIKYKL